MDRQGFENSGVTAGLPTPQRTTGISGTDPTMGSQQYRDTETNAGMTNTDTGLGTTGISPTGHTAGTVTDTGISGGTSTETRGTKITGVYVPVVPVELGDSAAGTTTETSRHSETRHVGEKKPMGEKIKEKIPGTQAHKEQKAEKHMAEGRI